MKKGKNKFGWLLLASAVVLAACSNEGGTAGSDNDNDAAAGGGEPTKLIVANGADPVTFDIQATNDQATTRVARQIYDTLITQTNDL